MLICFAEKVFGGGGGGGGGAGTAKAPQIFSAQKKKMAVFAYFFSLKT